MTRRNDPYEDNHRERGSRYPAQPEWYDETRGNRPDPRAHADAPWRAGRWQDDNDLPRGNWRDESRNPYETASLYGQAAGRPRDRDEDDRNWGRERADDDFRTFARTGDRAAPGREAGPRAWRGTESRASSWRNSYFDEMPTSRYGEFGRNEDYPAARRSTGRFDEPAMPRRAYASRDWGDAELSPYGRPEQAWTGEPGDFGARSIGGGTFRGRGPKGYARSDERLKEDISERLSDDPDIDAGEITVDVRSGIVTLSGAVNARWEKHHVENLVDRCSGVKDIENRLSVNKSGAYQRSGTAGATNESGNGNPGAKSAGSAETASSTQQGGMKKN